jgi:hypothetical protein
MHREPTTAREPGSIARCIAAGPTIAQVLGRIGPSWGGPIGRRLVGASIGRALGCPDHVLGPSIDRKSDVLEQEIVRGSGGASRSERP